MFFARLREHFFGILEVFIIASRCNFFQDLGVLQDLHFIPLIGYSDDGFRSTSFLLGGEQNKFVCVGNKIMPITPAATRPSYDEHSLIIINEYSNET